MNRSVPIGSYSAESGICLEWTYGFVIDARADGDGIVIRANAAGLTSLAQHLLTLALDGVPAGTHVHLGPYDALEESSAELILERIDDDPDDATAAPPGAERPS